MTDDALRDMVAENRRISAQMLGPAGEHEHIWGPVEEAFITGNPHRKCKVEGCRWVTLDLYDYFCHECGNQFAIDENGIANHVTLDGIDHDADADHVPYSLEEADDE